MSDKDKENRNTNKKKAVKYTCLSCNGTDTHWVLICGKTGTSKDLFYKIRTLCDEIDLNDNVELLEKLIKCGRLCRRCERKLCNFFKFRENARKNILAKAKASTTSACKRLCEFSPLLSQKINKRQNTGTLESTPLPDSVAQNEQHRHVSKELFPLRPMTIPLRPRTTNSPTYPDSFSESSMSAPEASVSMAERSSLSVINISQSSSTSISTSISNNGMDTSADDLNGHGQANNLNTMSSSSSSFIIEQHARITVDHIKQVRNRSDLLNISCTFV